MLEIILPQKQRFQLKGIQLVDVPSIEPQYIRDTSSLDISKVGRMEGTTSTFNWSFFDTPTFVPITEAKRTTG
jgi:hypothetical protein